MTFPRNSPAPKWAAQLVDVFRRHEEQISSSRTDARLSSEEVLTVLSADLQAIGFHIEKLKHEESHAQHAAGADAIEARKSHHFDVYQPEWMCCLAIEDGHDWANIGAADDLVEPLMVSNVDTLCLAVPFAEDRNGHGGHRAGEYERMSNLAEAVYGRTRVQLPQCLLLIGY